MLIPQMKRRSLLTGLASLSATSLFPLKDVVAAVNAAANDIEKITWSACTVNCGSRCPVRVSVKTAKSSVSKRITQEIPAPAPSEKIFHKSAPVSEAARFANVSTLPNA